MKRRTVLGLNPGLYTLVETPPTGYANSGAEALSQINPVPSVTSSTIQVNILDPTSLDIKFDSSAFFNRNLWDYLHFNFFGTPQDNTAGQFPITVTGTNTVTSGTATSSFLSLCWDLNNSLQDGVNVFPVLPTPGQGTPPNAGQIAYLFNHYGTEDIQGAAAANIATAASPDYS